MACCPSHYAGSKEHLLEMSSELHGMATSMAVTIASRQILNARSCRETTNRDFVSGVLVSHDPGKSPSAPVGLIIT